MSSVTMSGARAWICRSASRPSRAVPTTRNSSGTDITMSLTTRRMKALSSTTSTVRGARRRPPGSENVLAIRQGFDDDPTVGDVQKDAAAVAAADVLRDDRNPGLGQRAPRRLDVAESHVDPAGGEQGAEHAGPAGELGRERPLGAELLHLLEQQRHGSRRELRAIAAVTRHALARQQHVRQPAHARPRVVEGDRDTGAEPQRRDDGRAAGDRVVRDPDADLVAHARWKMRSRASTGMKRLRASPRSVSTFPRTRNPRGTSAAWKRWKSSSCVSRSK